VTRHEEGEEDGRLSRLIREGIVRPAHKPVASSLFTSQPPRPKGDASILHARIVLGGTFDRASPHAHGLDNRHLTIADAVKDVG
jgi:hypothetical protein